MFTDAMKKLVGITDLAVSKFLGPPNTITTRLLPREESNTPAILAMLLLDVSGSIFPRANDLRAGYSDYFNALKQDDLTSISVLTAITFVASDVKVIPFQPVIDFQPPSFVIGGLTMMGQGISTAVDAVETELRRLANAGRPVNRVSVVIVTDGKPTDDTAAAILKLKKLESLPFAQVFPIAVDEEAIPFLKLTSAKSEVSQLKSEPGSFAHLLRWLAEVQSTYSRSRPGEMVQLPPADSWKEEK